MFSFTCHEKHITFVPSKVPGLTIQGNLSLQDGDFDKFEADTNFDGTIDVDFSDRPLTRTPEVQAALQSTSGVLLYVPGKAGAKPTPAK